MKITWREVTLIFWMAPLRTDCLPGPFKKIQHAYACIVVLICFQVITLLLLTKKILQLLEMSDEACNSKLNHMDG